METDETSPKPDPQPPQSSPTRSVPRRSRVFLIAVLVSALVLGVVAILVWGEPFSVPRPEESRRPAVVSAPEPKPRELESAIEAPSTMEYVVEEGDSLFNIAGALDTDIDTLLALNDLPNPDMLSVGQVLAVPAYSPAVTALDVDDAPAANTYVVSEGDTILSIAEEMGVDADDLIAANDLADPDMILQGDELRIPD